MNKKEIMQDIKFREKCCAYGLDWQNFNIYEDVIILSKPKTDIYILLDENYNTMGIHKIELGNKERSIEEYAIAYKKLYYNVDSEQKFILPYPFQKYSLKQFVELSNRIQIYEKNHGHSFDMLVNGELVKDEHDSIYVCLLLYIKFLREQINQYFLNLYEMRKNEFQYPNVYQYMKNVMNNIEECIKKNNGKMRQLFLIDIIQQLGIDNETIEQNKHELYSIIELFSKDIEFDLSNTSIELLKILEITDEEVELRHKKIKNEFVVNEINLQSWLLDDFNKCKKK